MIKRAHYHLFFGSWAFLNLIYVMNGHEWTKVMNIIWYCALSIGLGYILVHDAKKAGYSWFYYFLIMFCLLLFSVNFSGFFLKAETYHWIIGSNTVSLAYFGLYVASLVDGWIRR